MTRDFLQRYLFKGELTLKTGLHIGGGRATLSPTDSPVIRTPDGKPFIPGSSFKGAFRSTVEKLAPLVDGLRSCGLDDDKICITPPGQQQEAFKTKRDNNGWAETKLLAELDQELCDTCKLFGSPYAASRINFSDLYTAEETEGLIQIRDGVAIDRDSEKAVDNLLYNYEVVAPTLTFSLEIMLEDPTPTDLGLTCLGLSEFMSGLGYIGGKRSRGLGQCVVEKLTIYHLDLSDKKSRGETLLKYLTGRTLADKMATVADVSAFINQQIEQLLTSEATHA